MKRVTWGLPILLLLTGCQKETGQRQTPFAGGTTALTKDDEVRIAVFRRFLDQNDRPLEKPDPERFNAFYLSVGGVNQERDPSNAVMAAIGRRRHPIKKVSQCVRAYREGDVTHVRCVDKQTLKPGCIFWVGQIKWIDPDTAEVEAGHWEHGLGASGATYQVRREQGGWQIEPVGDFWRS